MQMHKNKSVNVHQFAMVPKQDIPRSAFIQEKTHKTTFDAGYLIPIYLNEVLPGDSMALSMTAFTRLATPLYPVMDNLHLDSFFFFVPYRLLWTNWKKIHGRTRQPQRQHQLHHPAGRQQSKRLRHRLAPGLHGPANTRPGNRSRNRLAQHTTAARLQQNLERLVQR